MAHSMHAAIYVRAIFGTMVGTWAGGDRSRFWGDAVCVPRRGHVLSHFL